MHDLTVVIADLGPGGAQRVASVLANELSSRGVRVCFVTLSGKRADHFRLVDVITRCALDVRDESQWVVGAMVANFRRTRALRSAIRKAAAPTVLAFVGATNVLSILACVGLPVQVVVSERNDPERQSLGRIWDWLRRQTYPYASVVTANSQHALETMRQYVPAVKLTLVRNPVPVPPEVGEGALDPMSRILCVGRYSRQKGQDVLLTAFARVAPSTPGWRLALVGEGDSEASLRDQSETLGVAARVDWIRPVLDIWPIYRQAQMFVLPSRHEGTPNALLEAMACGLAVIVSDSSGGALDYVKDGTTGLVVPVDDVDALAFAMASLVSDPQRRARLGNSAKERVLAEAGGSSIATWVQILQLGKNIA